VIGLPRGLVRGARISALGVYVPERVVTNDELSQTLDTSDEWIVTRTGIRERRICAPDEATSDVAVAAAADLLAQNGHRAEDIQLVISTSLVPDHVFPATASVIAERIGAVNAGAFDVQSGCTGFVYGLACATAFVAAGLYEKVLVTGAESLSKALDWSDRSTCVLFGDGAGAVLVEPSDNGSMFAFDLGNDGAGSPFLNMPAGGTRLPASHETVDARQHYLQMNGPEVYRFAMRRVVDSCRTSLEAAGLTPADVDLFVPHQANLRIIEKVARALGFDEEQVFYNLDRYGNTSCASIPLCLHEAQQTGRLKHGDRLLMVGFGAGLTWGSCLTRWEL
jgi:3-oxoacyl-[acyl-carrier-protein] synthase III